MALSDRCSNGCVIAFFVTMIFMIIILLILVYVLCKLSYSNCKNKKNFKSQAGNKKQIDQFFKITCTISIIASIISVTWDFIHILQGYTLPLALHNHTFHEVRVFADFAMFVSFLSFYMYLYAGLRKTFQDTPLGISRGFTIFARIMFIIILILNIWYIALVLTDFNNHFNSNNTFYNDMHGIVYALFTYFYAFLFLCIVCNFIRKLRQLAVFVYLSHNKETVLTITSPTEATNVAYISSNLTPLPAEKLQTVVAKNTNVHITELVSLVTKQSVLAWISFVIFCLRFLYRIVIGTQYDQKNLSEIVWMVSYLLRDVTLLTNTFAIYLSFSFNRKQYNLCCNVCDKICRNICIWSMDKRRNVELQLEKQVNNSKTSNQNETKNQVTV